MIEYLVCVITASVLLLVYYQYERNKYIRDCLQIFRGPPPKFLLGNALEFGTNSVETLERLVKLQDKYGPISKFFIGPNRAYLLVSDPEFLEVLLTSHKNLKKGVDYDILRPWMRNGLLVSKGGYWQKRRKLITPTFHFKILDNFLPIFNSESDVLVQKLLSEVGKVIDIYPFITAFTLDSICETAMGISINAQKAPNNKYVNAVNILCGMYVKRKFSFWKRNDFLFQFSSDFKTQSEALDIIQGFTRSVIEKRRIDLVNQGGNNRVAADTGVKNKTAFLDLLLNATHDGDALSDDDIIEEVSTFLFTGHDTTASTISFALYEIAQNPLVQDKIIEELNEIFQNDGNRQPSMQDFNNMKYLELVIKETMRKNSTIAYIGRELEEDLEYKNTIIPKGVTVTAFLYHMHRRPDLFKNPEEFNPERFLNLEVKNPYTYIPFSAGPRNCIGQKYAMFELKAALSKILRNFKVLAADSKYNVVLSAEVIMKPANGVTIRLEKRQF